MKITSTIYNSKGRCVTIWMLNIDIVDKLGSGGWDLIKEEESARVKIHVMDKIILACISCFFYAYVLCIFFYEHPYNYFLKLLVLL